MGVNGIYGLSGSGLDIESMVKVGMMSKQNEYDKMAQKYTKNEWTKNALIDLNNQITTFNLSSLTDYKLQSNMNAKTATSSNEAAVKATSNANAPIMSHKVTVEDLSHNAYFIGSNRISTIIEGTLYNGTAAAVDSSKVKELADTAYLKDILFKGLEYHEASESSHTYTGGTRTQEYSLGGGGKITITTNGSGTSATYVDSANGINLSNGSVSSDGKTITFGDQYNNTQVVLSSNTPGGKIANANVTTTTTSMFMGFPTGPSTTNSTSDTVGNIEEKLSFTSSTNGNQTIIINTAADGTKTASYTNTKSEYGVANYQSGSVQSLSGTISGGTISFKNGTTLTLSGRTATVTNSSGGIVGATMNSYSGTDATVKTNSDGSYTFTGARSTLEKGYLDGRTKLVQKSDTAIEFTIADSIETGAKTATISFTYGQLLGDDSTDTKPMSMNDLISEINTQASNAGINLKATYDNLNGVFSIYNPTSDDKSSVVIKAANSNSSSTSDALSFQGQATMNFLNALGLKEFNGENLLEAKKISRASGGQFDATGSTGKITVDGMEYKTTDNKVTVGGVTYTAFSSTKDANGIQRPATVTVGQDVDAIVDRVKSFVESYNKILGSLYEKYDEKADSNYKPLTQSQKDQMKDEQIEKWEEKAKQGLLYHDQTLSKIINQMRNAISLEVEGIDSKYKSAYSIGIETTGLKGQLKFNEDKLRNALAEDGDAVSKIFTKLDTEAKPNASGIVKENGIAQRLGDILTNATKLIKNRAGSSTDIVEDSELNNLLRELQTKMSNFKKMMNAFEDRLYKKYDAMEVALSKLGTQLNFITGGQ